MTRNFNCSLCVSLLRNARLQLTEEFIRDLDDISTSQGTDEDMQRIQELMNLPQNEALSPDMSQ